MCPQQNIVKKSERLNKLISLIIQAPFHVPHRPYKEALKSFYYEAINGKLLKNLITHSGASASRASSRIDESSWFEFHDRKVLEAKSS